MHLPFFLVAILAIYLATAKLEGDASSAEKTAGKDEVDSYYSRYSGKTASSRYRYQPSYRYTGSARYSRIGSRYSGLGSLYRKRYRSMRYTGSRYVPSYRYRVGSRYISYRRRNIPLRKYSSRYTSRYSRIPANNYRQRLYNTGK